MLLLKPPSTNLQNTLAAVRVFHTVLLLTKSALHNHGIHWSSHVPHHSEAAHWREGWNGLLKAQLQHQLGASSWGEVLQEMEYVLKQHAMCGMVSPTARTHRSCNQGVE